MGTKSLEIHTGKHIPKQARFLTRKEVNNLLAACNTATNRGKRDLAILEVFLFLGLQVGEVIRLSSEHLVRDAPSPNFITLMGIRGTHVVKVPKRLTQNLNSWLDVVDQFKIETRNRIFLQIHKGDQVTGEPINARKIRKIIAEYGNRAGLSPQKGRNRLTPTDLRRTCGRNAYDHGARLLDVQSLLGHANPLSTARFIGVLTKRNPGRALNHLRY